MDRIKSVFKAMTIYFARIARLNIQMPVCVEYNNRKIGAVKYTSSNNPERENY